MICFLSFFFFTSAWSDDLESVKNLDLTRYAGLWYEIARLPMTHQEGCIKSQANYEISGDEVKVVNSCSLADGKTKKAEGIARVEDKITKAKLKVNFVPAWLRWIGIGWGDYWVIELDADYKYAVVSEPKKEYLWILSRSPSMNKVLYNEILARLKAKGFSLEKLIVSGVSE